MGAPPPNPRFFLFERTKGPSGHVRTGLFGLSFLRSLLMEGSYGLRPTPPQKLRGVTYACGLGPQPGKLASFSGHTLGASSPQTPWLLQRELCGAKAPYFRALSSHGSASQRPSELRSGRPLPSAAPSAYCVRALASATSASLCGPIGQRSWPNWSITSRRRRSIGLGPFVTQWGLAEQRPHLRSLSQQARLVRLPPPIGIAEQIPMVASTPDFGSPASFGGRRELAEQSSLPPCSRGLRPLKDPPGRN